MMGKGEPFSNKVLEKVCAYLECSVNDISAMNNDTEERMRTVYYVVQKLQH